MAKRTVVAMLALAGVAGCSPQQAGDSAQQHAGAVERLPELDSNTWRVVGDDNPQQFALWALCASGDDELKRADPTLANGHAESFPTVVEITRTGALQIACRWDDDKGRRGWIVVKRRCADLDDGRCGLFVYAPEGDHKILPSTAPEPTAPPLSHQWPPGADAGEQEAAIDRINWLRDNAADKLGSMRASFRGVIIGFDETARLPVICGEVKGDADWRRFIVLDVGASPAWFTDGEAVADCGMKNPGFQWYVVPASKL